MEVACLPRTITQAHFYVPPDMLAAQPVWTHLPTRPDRPRELLDSGEVSASRGGCQAANMVAKNLLPLIGRLLLAAGIHRADPK